MEYIARCCKQEPPPTHLPIIPLSVFLLSTTARVFYFLLGLKAALALAAFSLAALSRLAMLLAEAGVEPVAGAVFLGPKMRCGLRFLRSRMVWA